MDDKDLLQTIFEEPVPNGEAATLATEEELSDGRGNDEQ